MKNNDAVLKYISPLILHMSTFKKLVA